MPDATSVPHDLPDGSDGSDPAGRSDSSDRSVGSRPPRAADDARSGVQVERCIDLDAAPDEVWRTLTDPAELATWLGAEVVLDVTPGGVGHVVDDDGTVRQVLVTAVEPGHLLAWHWWEDGGELSTVEIIARPDGDGTLVRVVETLAAPVVTGGPKASARAGGAASATAVGRRWEAALGRATVGSGTPLVIVSGATPRR